MKKKRPSKKARPELIRETFPVIRIIFDAKGQRFYQVDARRKGTNGKQESFSDKEGAQTRANEIAAEYAANGNEGLALPAELRYMAFKGDEILKPYGKSILQACEHYRDYLAAEVAKNAGATVAKLAQEWYDFKQTGARKTIRKDTLATIQTGKLALIKAFGTRPVTSITENDIKGYIDPLPIAVISKRNTCSLFGQFFNWCIDEHKGLTTNPAKDIEYIFQKGNVTIWPIELARQAMALCEADYAELTTFHALGLFGGLRPFEAMQVIWSYVDWENKTLFIPKHISKVKDDRNVPINDTLKHWLELTPESERKGLMVRNANFSNRVREFRAKLGYAYKTERNGKPLNPKGPLGKWPTDVLRHSYASYWLPLHKDKGGRAQLAEDMGNSIDVIKDHYKQLAQKSVAVKFWDVVPKAVAERRERERAELKREQEEADKAGTRIVDDENREEVDAMFPERN